jgi:hypothetical protein
LFIKNGVGCLSRESASILRILGQSGLILVFIYILIYSFGRFLAIIEWKFLGWEIGEGDLSVAVESVLEFVQYW